ncbi:MlaD family protein [Mycobacterium parmense]|uniref:Mammalian cell entry protein n=1 Tax=Mycobacterium parmense TaxID=185642 RepID=A0A7I7YPV0_9MYCO|nr:MlaD family protein [Mycobacterium parmense]MCV7349476.1 MCE family protein [Mycobacterium parmense]ORW56944.1 mammalian cell entry protein [Mycobacterium parmense]BBZ43895.1 mammalian cell entry protein [Mycobacterium parmense]
MTARRGRAALAMAVSAALVSSGCATNGLASLPLPAPGLGTGGYTLTAVFASALNLPANAKVKLAGADVGQVESMVARNYTAVTTLRIRRDVLLPRGSTAELRTATPLGDVFVALKPPADDPPEMPMLHDGDTIGLESTGAASTFESVLSSAAVMVNGGAVRNFTNLINGLGNAAGDRGQAFGELVRRSNQLLGTLDARSGQLSTAMTEMSRLSGELESKDDAMTELMAAAGPGTDALASNTTQLSGLAIQLGDTARLLSRFPSIGGTDTSGRSIVSDLNTIAAAANDVAVSPDTSWLAVNRLLPPMIKVTAGYSVAVSASFDKLILGSIPDIGFPGDVGLHGPHRYNWNQFIGSLKYTLWRLQERVVGRGPNSPQVPLIPDPVVPGQLDIAPAPAPPGPNPPGPQR